MQAFVHQINRIMTLPFINVQSVQTILSSMKQLINVKEITLSIPPTWPLTFVQSKLLIIMRSQKLVKNVPRKDQVSIWSRSLVIIVRKISPVTITRRINAKLVLNNNHFIIQLPEAVSNVPNPHHTLIHYPICARNVHNNDHFTTKHWWIAQHVQLQQPFITRKQIVAKNVH